MRNALKASTDHSECLLNLPQDVHLAAVMEGLQPAVKWVLEGVSASHNLLEKAAIAVLTATITTLSAFGIQ